MDSLVDRIPVRLYYERRKQLVNINFIDLDRLCEFPQKEPAGIYEKERQCLARVEKVQNHVHQTIHFPFFAYVIRFVGRRQRGPN